MIYVNNPVFLDVDFGSGRAGLSTVGFTLYNPDSPYSDRITAGIIDTGDGSYGVMHTFLEPWDGYIKWDTGQGPNTVYAQASIEVLPSTSIVSPTFSMSGPGSNQGQFLNLVNLRGSNGVYHREMGGISCPCISPEGYRSPKWHIDNPLAPVCNEQGKLNYDVISIPIKGFFQPVQSSRATRLSTEYVEQLFGQLETDDYLLISPLEWNGIELNYNDWDQTGEDYMLFHNRRYFVVNSNEIPDPANGDPHHHEVGLRLVKTGRPV